MKTKLISKTIPSGSMAFIADKTAKLTSIVLLVLLSLTPKIITAQNTGALSGTGMGICSTFVFNSTASNPVIKPLNYGSQYYACTGRTDNDISFSPQGTLWRVQYLSWNFVPSTSAGATLDGYDASGNVITQVVMNAGDVLTPYSYLTVGGVNCVTFYLNGSALPGTYNRSNWYITAP